jgi:hypothetical protein
MKNMGGAIYGWISGLLGGIKDDVLSFFGIASPSKLFTYYGEMIMAGFVRGMDKAMPDVDKAMDRLNVAATPVLNTGSAAYSMAIYAPTDAPSAEEYASAMRDVKPEVVVKVDSREIARSVDEGNRKNSRRGG